MNYDCVYFWNGGLERGKWRCAQPNIFTPEAERDIDAFERSIARQGYFTVRGSTRIGPPDNPPPPAAWQTFQDALAKGTWGR